MTNKLSRQEAYAIIDGERAYQESLGPERKETAVGSHMTQAEYFTLLRVYIAKAEAAWANNPGRYVEEAQAHVRKLAALCVASMEAHGAPQRT